jgi:hypothetical protein
LTNFHSKEKKMSSRFAEIRARARGESLNAKTAMKPAKADGEEEIDPNLDPENEDEDELELAKKDKPMTEKTKANDDAVAVTAVASPIIDFNARMQTVFASEQVKGKSEYAAAILADTDFNGLSAEAVIKLVAKHETPSADKDSGEAAKILAAISGGNANLGTDSGNTTSEPENSAVGWNKAVSAINARNGLN